MAKIKTVLVSQPKPTLVNSPYFDLQKKRKLKIDFIHFIHVKGATLKEIRLQTFNPIHKKEKSKNILDKSSKKIKEKINEIKNKDIRNSLSQLLDVAKND